MFTMIMLLELVETFLLIFEMEEVKERLIKLDVEMSLEFIALESTTSLEQDLLLVLLPSQLVNKLKLFKFLSLHQLDKPVKTTFHTVLVKSQSNKFMVPSVLYMLLTLPNVLTHLKFMLLGEMNQMSIFSFLNLQEMLFGVMIASELLETLLI